jgi:hypothetical protein
MNLRGREQKQIVDEDRATLGSDLSASTAERQAPGPGFQREFVKGYRTLFLGGCRYPDYLRFLANLRGCLPRKAKTPAEGGINESQAVRCEARTAPTSPAGAGDSCNQTTKE